MQRAAHGRLNRQHDLNVSGAGRTILVALSEDVASYLHPASAQSRLWWSWARPVPFFSAMTAKCSVHALYEGNDFPSTVQMFCAAPRGVTFGGFACCASTGELTAKETKMPDQINC
jgi:hypothetical protein